MGNYTEEDDDDYPINDSLPEEERWERGCLFGLECLMPGDHMRVECYTREMAEAWAIEYEEID